jgi:protein TonB
VAIQGVFVGAVVLAPIIYTDTLPGLRLQAEAIAMPVTPPPRGITQQQTTTGGGGSRMRSIVTEAPDEGIRVPREIPRDIADINELSGPPNLRPDPVAGCQMCVPHGTERITAALPVPPAAPPTPTRVVRSSVLLEGRLVHKVMPVYPPPARAARIEGAVVLRAVIARDGTMQSVRVLRGHPMLAPSAEDAVRQWLYRPYLLNGEATEVETQITVNFVLNR